MVTDESESKQIVKDSEYVVQVSGEGAKGELKVTHVHQYEGRPPTYLAPFQAPPLPPHFIPRPEVSDALKARLLTDESTAPGVPFDRAHGVLVVSAIHGLGGIGKSVLAAALAHDPEVQARLPDGVLWATLGREPDLLSLLSRWIREGLGDYDYKPTTVDGATDYLRTLLHEKAVLLVVDDAWDPEHALPFKTGGPRCQVLITTRRADVADEVGADLYQLDVMTPEQSLDLLAARLGRALEETERDKALRLAEAVGYLPLALELAAARIARGVAWEALRAALEEEIARLEMLEGPRRKTRPRLEASFHLSLDALRAENEGAWQAFVWLGVLPEDVAVTAPMAATLWEMDQATAAETLELLWNDALLLPGSPVWIGEERWPSYRLHDLLHDIARRLLTAPSEPRQAGDLPGLGLTLPEAHAHLLARYRAQTQDDLWHTLPDDGYIHAHLAWHLEWAGWVDELHAMLREETSVGRNGWYESRERLGQVAGFLTDVGRAWQLANAQVRAQSGGSGIGLEIRYSLVIASLNSMVSKIPAHLLAMLVEKKVWSPGRGIVYASQVPHLWQRVKTWADLAPHLTEALLLNVLLAAQMIRRDWYRAEAIAELAPHLSKSLALMRKALTTAQEIEHEQSREKALSGLCPYLPKTLLQVMLVATREIENEYYQANALMRLAPRLAELGYPEEAMAVVQEIKKGGQRVEALAGMVPYLPNVQRLQVLREALVATRELENEYQRMDALSKLIPCLLEPLLLQEALVIAQEIERTEYQERVLERLYSRLEELLYPQEVLNEARERWHAISRAEILEEARKCKNAGTRAIILADLAPHLSEPQLQEALEAAQASEKEYDRVKVLRMLAPHLPEALLQDALVIAREMTSAQERAEALAGLVRHLPAVQQRQVLKEALAAAQVIGDEMVIAEALAKLVSRLAELGQCKKALATAQEIGESVWYWRLKALSWLIPHLPEHFLQEAHKTALKFGSEYNQAEVLMKLALRLAELGSFQDALVMARGIGFESWRAAALTRVAKYLPKTQCTEVLQEALVTTRKIESNLTRSNALTELASYLPEAQQIQILREALAAVGMIQESSIRADALTELTAHLSKPLLKEAMVMVQKFEKPEYQTYVLVGLASRLAELGNPQEAMETAWEIEDTIWRMKTMKELAPYLSGTLLQEVLAAARELIEGWLRAQVLANLAPSLPEAQRSQVIKEALLATQEIKWDKSKRAEVLAAVVAKIVPYLPKEQRFQILEEALLALAQEIEQDYLRAEPLAQLAPYVVELPISNVIVLWQKILPDLSKSARRDILVNLCSLTPVIAALGGEQAVAETINAIQDVGRWWP
jgi:hypothetical protein